MCEIEVSPEEQDFLQEIMHDENKEEKKFITSPADIDTYWETKLKDAELSKKDRRKFEALCIQYDDVFSQGFHQPGEEPTFDYGNRYWRSPSQLHRDHIV